MGVAVGRAGISPSGFMLPHGQTLPLRSPYSPGSPPSGRASPTRASSAPASPSAGSAGAAAGASRSKAPNSPSSPPASVSVPSLRLRLRRVTRGAPARAGRGRAGAEGPLSALLAPSLAGAVEWAGSRLTRSEHASASLRTNAASFWFSAPVGGLVCVEKEGANSSKKSFSGTRRGSGGAPASAHVAWAQARAVSAAL